MSSTGNSPEPDPEGLDNASVSLPSLATLQDLPVHIVLHEPHWHDSGSSTPDFQQRVVASGRYSLPHRADEPRTIPASSDTSSMSVRPTAEPLGSRYSSSSRTPSLSYASSASGLSARTSAADSGPRYPLIDEDGNLDESYNYFAGIWPCSFRFLGCERYCEGAENWQTHCLSHFRGHLPSSVQCPFGCDRTFNKSGDVDAWSQLWDHVLSTHGSGGMFQYRPDSKLIAHLWRTGVINDAQEQELRRTRFLSGDGRPYLQPAGRERRRNRH